MDIASVKDMITAMGLPVTSDAQRLMNDIEQQQKQVRTKSSAV